MWPTGSKFEDFQKIGSQSSQIIFVSTSYSKINHIPIVHVQVLFEMAVSRYIEQPEKKDLLLHLLQWMTGQGYVVNSSTRNLILKNSHLFGRQLIAEVLSKQQAKLRAQKSQ